MDQLISTIAYNLSRGYKTASYILDKLTCEITGDECEFRTDPETYLTDPYLECVDLEDAAQYVCTCRTCRAYTALCDMRESITRLAHFVKESYK